MNRIAHVAVFMTLYPLALVMVFTAASPPLGAQVCTPTSTALILDGGYRVSMCYRTPNGTVGQAQSGIWSSQESGLLWFFERGNAEVLVKVLDACSVPASQGGTEHRWVFVAPVTTLGFNLEITAPSGQVWRHSNSEGRTASARSDLYAFPCSGRPSGPSGFDLASVNSNPSGITHANGRFFVVDSTIHEHEGVPFVYAYNASTGSRDPGYDFGLAYGNTDPEGITYWNDHLFVVDRGGVIFGYSVGQNSRPLYLSTYDIDLALGNWDPRGIAVAAIGGTDYFFVVDWTAGNEKVYAYNAVTRVHEPTYDFDLAPENSFPEGISFADAGGVGVLLVVDWLDEKAYAYGLQREPAADVTFDAHNGDPRGIVQHGGALYVVDNADSYVYAYVPYGTTAIQAEPVQPVLTAPVSERAAGVTRLQFRSRANKEE